jgi:exonuclease III
MFRQYRATIEIWYAQFTFKFDITTLTNQHIEVNEIISYYNVNGIRAMKKDFYRMAYHSRSVCVFTEIMHGGDQIDTEAFKEAGYEYQYYYSARKGYSGTPLFLDQPIIDQNTAQE